MTARKSIGGMAPRKQLATTSARKTGWTRPLTGAERMRNRRGNAGPSVLADFSADGKNVQAAVIIDKTTAQLADGSEVSAQCVRMQ